MIRLDKYLADAAGLTRSEAARMIRSGMAAVNGSVIRRPEQKFDENTAAVTLNGTPCSYRRFCYYLLDKPTGLIGPGPFSAGNPKAGHCPGGAA